MHCKARLRSSQVVDTGINRFYLGSKQAIMIGKSAELMVGSQAPDFRLSASDGREVGLADFRTKSNVYVFFVREFN
jgi:hypothetical protein